MRTRIKICCISSVNEAKLAIDHGADAIGLVGKMPSGPGPIPDWLIAEIVKTIHPPIASFPRSLLHGVLHEMRLILPLTLKIFEGQK